MYDGQGMYELLTNAMFHSNNGEIVGAIVVTMLKNHMNYI